MKQEKCPFKAGDVVVYRPSNRGRNLVTMTELSALVPEKEYKVARIDNEYYIVVEGFENAVGGGLFWTEFSED